MKELKSELVKKAQANMMAYIMGTGDPDLSKEVAYILAYIRFARAEKHLFQLIFTSGGLSMKAIDEAGTVNKSLDMNMIIYANGIVMMQAFHTIGLTEDKIREMLIQAYELFSAKK